MHGNRFDELTRHFARLRQGTATRRAVLGAAGSLVALPASGNAAPGQSVSQQTRFQDTAADPLIAEIAFQLEYDVEKIFRFVADEIQYQAYAGALRGPIGTLWSGAGNSVDQAQLLKALLDVSKVPGVYTFGELDDAAAADLLAAVSLEPAPSLLVSDAMNRLAPAIPTAAATPAPDASQKLSELKSIGESLLADSADAIERDVDAMSALLTDAGLLAVAAASDLPDLERTQHTWIRIPFGAGTVDLDPAFAGAALGDLRATGADATSSGVRELPEELFHQVRIKIDLDSRSGDTLRTGSTIDQSFRSQDLVGTDIVFAHIPPQSLKAIGYSLQEALEGTATYWTVLGVGSQSFLGDQSIVFNSGGGALGELFDDGVPGGPIEGETIAERLEIEVTSPGSAVTRAVRSIFDRVADQRSADVIDFETVVPIELTGFGDGVEGYPALEQVYAISSVVCQVPESFLRPATGDDIGFPEFGGALHTLHAVRQRLQGRVSAPSFLDRPNVSSMRIALVPQPDQDSPAVTIQADLMIQGYGVDPANRHGARIRAGVVAQAAEEIYLNGELLNALYTSGTLPSPVAVGAPTAAVVFRAAAEQSIDSRVVTSGADLDGLALDDQSRLLIAAHLADGRAIIIPERPVLVGVQSTRAWWVFDPVTGDFWDQLPDGRSGAAVLFGPMAEYAVELWTFTKTLKGILILGACIFQIVATVGAFLNGLDSPTAGNIVGYFGNGGAAVVACVAYAAAGAV